MSTHVIERMAVEVDGSGEALVMLHGLGGTSNVFTPQMGLLGPRFRVIRFDLPGAGRSAAAAISIQSLVDLLLRALRVLGVERAHWAGHSMGTILCQHVAVREPRLVNTLALMGPLRAPPDTARQTLRERAVKARTQGMADIADAVLAAATSGDTKTNNPVASACIRELLMRQDPEGYARNCEALAEAAAADITQIRCRTLLLAGDEDAIAPPSSARDMAQQISGAGVVVLRRCGHWVTLERAPEVNAELKEFYFGRR